ncbi:FadR/GntR family transcriptional regulator [Paenibacillus humicola]|uniref:FadR/GntR family transcriptional regulator n=1 Tax=Paenibacillus humicola TaxID=3110540 RepID=UPI00237B7345|nr:FadR/GntR family transcriptional regulator [Paenibacillus humicola]
MRPIKIEARKGHEIVASHILQRIESGELKPGQKLPSVVDLAAAYGVGRSTIREAVSALKATGWLDVRHGGGTFVSPVLPAGARGDTADLFKDAESVLELLEVRKALETEAAALAAERRTAEDLGKMRAILLRMEQVMLDADTSEGERADVQFHTAIAAASGNSLLLQLMESISLRLGDSIRRTRELWFYEEQATAERLLEEHKSIFAAIEVRDKEAAAARIGAHLAKVENVLKPALRDAVSAESAEE